jgi:hypothetical protein
VALYVQGLKIRRSVGHAVDDHEGDGRIDLIPEAAIESYKAFSRQVRAISRA